MQVLDPIQEARGSKYEPSARLETLDGKTLGLFSNQKLNASRLLELVAEELGRTYDFIVKRGTYHPQMLMSPDEWGDVDGCDAVVLANGDCGACSSSGVANAIELEKRGIPTLLISTPPFVDAVRIMAGLSGMEGLKWAVVEHPIGSVSDDELMDRARRAAGQFDEIVLGGHRTQN